MIAFDMVADKDVNSTQQLFNTGEKRGVKHLKKSVFVVSLSDMVHRCVFMCKILHIGQLKR